MTINHKENYVFIDSDQDSFVNFLTNFEQKHSDLAKNNLIISLSDNMPIEGRDIFVFLKYANLHQENGTTFVLVCKDIDIDIFPEAFNITPTLREAEDILVMEDIQRDLGF